MPRIEYNAARFGSAWPILQATPSGVLSLSWDDLVWAAITVGKFDMTGVTAFGRFSLSEMLFRVNMLYANLMETPSGELTKSPLYINLDPTEKGAVSYFLGMVVSKVIADRYFQTPWLVHLEKLKSIITFAPWTGYRPDLLGRTDREEWIVLEAKGRSGAYSQEALTKAKKQTRAVRRVGGQYPVLRAASEAYFKPDLAVDLVDPETFDDDAFDVEISPEAFISAYYDPLRSLVKRSDDVIDIGSERFHFVRDEHIGLAIGITEGILEGTYPVKSGREDHRSVEIMNKSFVAYSDGVAVGLDSRIWSDKQMVLPPEERILNQGSSSNH